MTGLDPDAFAEVRRRMAVLTRERWEQRSAEIAAMPWWYRWAVRWWEAPIWDPGWHGSPASLFVKADEPPTPHVRHEELATEILVRVVRTLDFADEEHDGPITAEVDTDVVRAAIVNGPEDLDSFVLRATVDQIVKALTAAHRG